jgi:hypothetical protein
MTRTHHGAPDAITVPVTLRLGDVMPYHLGRLAACFAAFLDGGAC